MFANIFILCNLCNFDTYIIFAHLFFLSSICLLYLQKIFKILIVYGNCQSKWVLLDSKKIIVYLCTFKITLHLTRVCRHSLKNLNYKLTPEHKWTLCSSATSNFPGMTSVILALWKQVEECPSSSQWGVQDILPQMWPYCKSSFIVIASLVSDLIHLKIYDIHLM